MPLTTCFQETAREELCRGKNLGQGLGVWACLQLAVRLWRQPPPPVTWSTQI